MDVEMKTLNNQSGLASLESIALLIIFAVLIGYGIGFFGVVHTGILNSIAARTYAIETLDNRVDTTYFRSNKLGGDNGREYYSKYGFRAHGIASENMDPYSDPKWEVTERSISIGRPNTRASRSTSSFSNGVREANPVWIKTIYGICLTATCGGAGS
jgi:hypothetical protein